MGKRRGRERVELELELEDFGCRDEFQPVETKTEARWRLKLAYRRGIG
jgi:hypothetical protein